MKTICSLLVTLLVTVVLVASAANNQAGTETVSITCTPSDCTGPVQIQYSNLSLRAYYTLTGANDAGDSCCGGTFQANSDGTLTFNEAFLSTGNWDFNLTEVHKNGNPVHNGLVLDTTLDVP
jgi:hypothetical protein